MMTTFRIAFAAAGIAALLLPAAAFAGGGSLNRTTFERCNQQAMQVAGISDSQSPAASPGMPGSSSSTSGSLGSGTGTQSGSSSAPATSGSTGSATGGAYSSGTQSGTSSTAASGAGDQDKIDKAVQAYRDCLQK